MKSQPSYSPPKLLIWCANYFPEPTGVGKYQGELAQWFSTHGYAVQVFTTFAYYPRWKSEWKWNEAFYNNRISPTLSVRRFPTFVIGKAGGSFSRIFLECSFSFLSLPFILCELLKYKRNVIFSTVEPSFLTGLGLSFLNLFFGSFTWIHVQDLQLDLAVKMRFVPQFMKKPFKWLGGIIYRRASILSSISPNMCEEIAIRSKRPDVRLYPNWVDTKTITPSLKSHLFLKQFGISSEKFIFLYSGSIGNKQELEQIILLAERFKNSTKAHFIIAGFGPTKEILIAEAQRKELKNLSFIDPVPYEQLSVLLNCADVHLVLQTADVSDLVFPSKVSGILSVGGCSIVTAPLNSQLGKLISENQVGIRVEASDSESLFQESLSLLEDPQKVQTFKLRARQFAVLNWDIDFVLNQMNKDFLDLTSKNQK